MTYTGKHYYTYSDPQVLAVLASPPYFSDLLDRDDLSGNYAESSTTYSSMKGTENGTVLPLPSRSAHTSPLSRILGIRR